MTDEAKQQELVDWRIGFHIEAAAKLIAASIYALSRSIDAQNVRWDRIADAMERQAILTETDITLRRESQEAVNRSAERVIAGMAGLTGLGLTPPESEPTRPPEWVKDVVKD